MCRSRRRNGSGREICGLAVSIASITLVPLRVSISNSSCISLAFLLPQLLIVFLVRAHLSVLAIITRATTTNGLIGSS